jgi:hypothetical protein
MHVNVCTGCEVCKREADVNSRMHAHHICIGSVHECIRVSECMHMYICVRVCMCMYQETSEKDDTAERRRSIIDKSQTFTCTHTYTITHNADRQTTRSHDLELPRLPRLPLGLLSPAPGGPLLSSESVPAGAATVPERTDTTLPPGSAVRPDASLPELTDSDSAGPTLCCMFALFTWNAYVRLSQAWDGRRQDVIYDGSSF